ncbi:MAG TPA: peptide-methionine (S)-S-oxide reductase MsrA [Abditibacteriaceae bacterium]
MKYSSSIMQRALSGTLLLVAAPALFLGCGPASAEKHTDSKMAPVVKPAKGEEVATFAAGCFWSMEAIFEEIKGVSRVEPGYSGGKVKNPTYEQVSSSATGHAEAVDIHFDPKVVSYQDLVEVLLTLRDPTTVDQQGPDYGPQYRSVIFYRSEAQKKSAEEMIKQIAKKGLWKDPLVIRVEPFTNFYVAEDYHRDYFKKNPDKIYCQRMISPKIEALKVKFKDKAKK